MSPLSHDDAAKDEYVERANDDDSDTRLENRVAHGVQARLATTGSVIRLTSPIIGATSRIASRAVEYPAAADQWRRHAAKRALRDVMDAAL